MEKAINEIFSECCLVCEEHSFKGIHIFDRFICHDCERKVIQTDTSHENYQFYLEKLRKLRLSRLA